MKGLLNIVKRFFKWLYHCYRDIMCMDKFDKLIWLNSVSAIISIAVLILNVLRISLLQWLWIVGFYLLVLSPAIVIMIIEDARED